jgi:hypothetical protein
MCVHMYGYYKIMEKTPDNSEFIFRKSKTEYNPLTIIGFNSAQSHES